MSMFSMGGSIQAASISINNSNFIKAGIHEVVFKGIELVETADAAIIKFEAVDGSAVHNERLFSPRSGERGDSSYGKTPSEFEQFLSKCKCIIKALDPDLYEKIEKDGDKFTAPDFESFVKLLKKYLDKKVGATTHIKLVPTGKGNYVGFPGFPARLSKDEKLYIANNFIGDNLVLTAAEVKKIDEVANARPTDMKKADNSGLDDIADDFNVTDPTAGDDDEDGLPF